MKNIFFLLLICLTTQTLAQSKALFEYTITKDDKLFNLENGKLSYADSNSVIKINIEPTPYLLASVPTGIDWHISNITVTGATGKRATYTKRLSSNTFVLNMMDKVEKASQELNKKHLPNNARIIIEVNMVVGTKDGVSKKFTPNDIISLPIEVK